MLQIAPGVRVYLACRPVDMRRGFDGLSADVAQVLKADPFSGAVFVFRGKRGESEDLDLGRFGVLSVRKAAREAALNGDGEARSWRSPGLRDALLRRAHRSEVAWA